MCPLHETAQTVCLIGNGPVPAEVMVVGEAPGFREDEISEPFSGASGKYLRETLKSVGIQPTSCFITNVNKCRPPENRKPKAGEATACRGYLERELGFVKPQYILTVGNHALRLVKKGGIMKKRGKPIDFSYFVRELGEDGIEMNQRDCIVFPTIHPAAVLRNPKNKKLFETDIEAFARLLKGEKGNEGPKRVMLAKNKRQVKAIIRAILDSEAVAYDIETYGGFDEWKPGVGICTVSFSTEPGVAYVLPVDHPQAPWGRKLGYKLLKMVITAMMFSKCKMVAHNGKFDDRWLRFFTNLNLHCDFDTILSAHLLDENRAKALEVLATMLLGADAYGIDTSDNRNESLKRLALYNAKDTEFTLVLYYKFKAQLKKERRTARVFAKLMMPASRTITRIEERGMWVDNDRLEKRIVQVSDLVDEMVDDMNSIAGVETNWNSYQQVGEVLFKRLGLPLIELTATGNASTKESVLLHLASKHELPRKILKYRKHAKDLNTYLVRWSEVQDEHGRVHPNYKLFGTVTGRLSSGKDTEGHRQAIGIQQVPRDTLIRSVLGAPPGWRFLEFDFSQIELRIAAHLSREPTMLRYFQEGRDIHLSTAAAITGKHPDTITKEERKKAKAVNFGFLYGMGWNKFIMYALENYEVIVSPAEAKAVRKRYFDEYAGLLPWHKRQKRLVNLYGEVHSIIGRTRHLPDIHSPDKDVVAEAERQAINSPVQGLASDMMLLGLTIIDEMIPEDEGFLVGSVHDSGLMEIREDCIDKWAPVIKHTMENLPIKKKFGATLNVPIIADVTVGQHWGEGEEWAA
jgi:DNA polymerase-1